MRAPEEEKLEGENVGGIERRDIGINSLVNTQMTLMLILGLQSDDT